MRQGEAKESSSGLDEAGLINEAGCEWAWSCSEGPGVYCHVPRIIIYSYVCCDSQERHSEVVVFAAVGPEAHHLDRGPGVLDVAMPKLT